MLTENQKTELKLFLPRSAIMTRKVGGQEVSYLPNHHVFREANRIFGPDGWEYELSGPVCETFRGTKPNKDGGENIVIQFEARVRVRVGGCTHEDVGLDVCDVPDRADAIVAGIDKARKGCVTDAIKRGLRTFGDPLGLALYEKSQSHVGYSYDGQRIFNDFDGTEDAQLAAWWAANQVVIDRLPSNEREDLAAEFRERAGAVRTPAPPTVSVPVPARPAIPASTATPPPAAAPAQPAAPPRTAPVGQGNPLVTEYRVKLAAATDRAGVDAVMRQYAMRISGLSEAMKAECREVTNARRAAVDTTLSAFDALAARIRSAPNAGALDALFAEIESAQTAGALSGAQYAQLGGLWTDAQRAVAA